MRKHFYLLSMALIALLSGCSTKHDLVVQSPDKNIILKIIPKETGGLSGDRHPVAFTLNSRGSEILNEVVLDLEFDKVAPFLCWNNIEKTQLRQIDTKWERVWGRSKHVRNHYNELKLFLADKEYPHRKINVIFRVYDDGTAFRYELPAQDSLKEFTLVDELTSFHFGENKDVWATKYEGSYSHQENEFKEKKLNDLDSAHLPLLANISEDIWIAITEADLENWSGMHLISDSLDYRTLKIKLAPRKDDPNSAVKSSTPAVSPWRVIMIASTPGKFLESDIIQNLNEPCEFEDVSWIKPGRAAWDWWWCNRYAPDAGFNLGPDSETMKYFIDFASEMTWEYQLIDWQWYGEPFAPTDEFINNPNPNADITTSNPDIDIPELVKYARERNVKLLLWLEWNHADRQMEKAFPLYEKWGIAGVKIDFMAGENQEMVDFYNRAVKLAAKHHLLVDFHGAYKPTGVSRTYPNLITREGVLGNEYSKWSDRITPEHTVTLAFTRGILGEMDFTPGAFVNAAKDRFKTQDKAICPMVMGTRCHQLAMPVVYESALQVFCDSPFNYRSSSGGLDFYRIVPTTWDETKVIDEKIGDYITIARRSGRNWFVGSMTDWDERELDIPFGFLDEGKYSATIWKDGEDANDNPVGIAKEEIEIDNQSILRMKLAKGGGFVMHIRPR